MINKNNFKPCWQYYNCSEISMHRCPAFNQGFNCKRKFTDCWFYIDDINIGGPEKNGPCIECEWNRAYGIFSKEI